MRRPGRAGRAQPPPRWGRLLREGSCLRRGLGDMSSHGSWRHPCSRGCTNVSSPYAGGAFRCAARLHVSAGRLPNRLGHSLIVGLQDRTAEVWGRGTSRFRRQALPSSITRVGRAQLSTGRSPPGVHRPASLEYTCTGTAHTRPAEGEACCRGRPRHSRVPTHGVSPGPWITLHLCRQPSTGTATDDIQTSCCTQPPATDPGDPQKRSGCPREDLLLADTYVESGRGPRSTL